MYMCACVCVCVGKIGGAISITLHGSVPAAAPTRVDRCG